MPYPSVANHALALALARALALFEVKAWRQQGRVLRRSAASPEK